MSEDTVNNTGADAGQPAEGVDIAKSDGGVTETNTENVVNQQGVEDTTSTQEVKLDYSALKLPEGVSVSDEDKANLEKIATRLGIKDQDSLQAFADWAMESSQEIGVQEAKQAEEAKAKAEKEWADIKAGWEESLKGDADFGKDYDLNIKRANEAIAKFGGSELSQWLKDADLATHPAVLKTFARIGKEIEDAKILKGSKGVETPKRKLDMYGSPMIEYNE